MPYFYFKYPCLFIYTLQIYEIFFKFYSFSNAFFLPPSSSHFSLAMCLFPKDPRMFFLFQPCSFWVSVKEVVKYGWVLNWVKKPLSFKEIHMSYRLFYSYATFHCGRSYCMWVSPWDTERNTLMAIWAHSKVQPIINMIPFPLAFFSNSWEGHCILICDLLWMNCDLGVNFLYTKYMCFASSVPIYCEKVLLFCSPFFYG